MTGPADHLPALLATELGRQYDIARLLGRGGMGAVWLARERSLDRLVAIKVLAGDAIERGDVRDRFRREARIAARLVHPNIVPLHSFGETTDALYFVMGYVEGETLATRLEREGRISRQMALRILGEIADALAFAHREGVVHRDVKPENILIDARSGRALLADFGVARVEGPGTSVTMTGVAVGTPSYMSPEQALAAKEIDGRSDLYSLGIVGYRMLAGRLPFTGATLHALMSQHALAKPDDLALVVDAPDRAVARHLMRAIEKEPAARWGRAEDLRDALQRAATEVAELPEELDRVDAVGTKALVPLFAFGQLIYYLTLLTRSPEVGLPYYGMLVGALTILIGRRALPAARSFGWRETLRALFHPPQWWSSWWPRALRRPDDVWDRLPPVVRRLRNCRDATVALMVGHITILVPLFITNVIRDPLAPVIAIGTTAGITVGIGAIVAATRAARKALMDAGLTEHDASKVGSLPNSVSDPRWKNPQFARLLAAERGDEKTSRIPRTPADLVRAIEQMSDRLRPGGLLPDDDSAAAARAVLSAIEALEAEIQRIHGDVDPAESERLERRLAALEGRNDDVELRTLLEGQRAVLRRLEQRRKEKQARRDRLRDLLQTLWVQLVDLDARVARGAAVDPELTGQVRALTADLARAGEALTEAERLLAPAERPVVTPL